MRASFCALRCSWSPPSSHGNYQTQLRKSSLTSKNILSSSSTAIPGLKKDLQQQPNQGRFPAGASRGPTEAETPPKQLVRATLPSADWAFIALLSCSFWCNPLIPVLLYLPSHSSSSWVENPQSLTQRIRKKLWKSSKTLLFQGQRKDKWSSEEQAYHCCSPTDCFTYTSCMIFYPSHFKSSLFGRIRISSCSAYMGFVPVRSLIPSL